MEFFNLRYGGISDHMLQKIILKTEKQRKILKTVKTVTEFFFQHDY